MRKYKDSVINNIVIVLSLFGIVMIGTASIGSAIVNPTITLINMGKQFAFFIIGYFIMTRIISIYEIRGKDSRKTVEFIYYVVFILIIITLAMPARGGARNWIILPGNVTIQPSEFAKPVLILILAYMFNDFNLVRNPKDFFRLGLVRPFSYVGLIVLFVLIQDDFGTAVIITGISISCFYACSNVVLKRYQLVGVILFIGAVIAIPIIAPQFLRDYQMARITAMQAPLSDPYGDTYQLVNSLIALATATFFGKGFGHSTQKYGYIPASHNDYIFAIIVEELGIFGALLITVAYWLLIYRLIGYAMRIKDERARIVLFGSSTFFIIHFLFNIGGISGLIPMTGVGLMFISAGGSSLWAAMIVIGICQSIIARYNMGKIE